MSNNHIDHLYIKDFEFFNDLKIDGLKDINMIFGGNGTGKTWLLRAIDLICKSNTTRTHKYSSEILRLPLILRKFTQELSNIAEPTVGDVKEFMSTVFTDTSSVNELVIKNIDFNATNSEFKKITEKNTNIQYVDGESGWKKISDLLGNTCISNRDIKKRLEILVKDFMSDIDEIVGDPSVGLRFFLNGETNKSLELGYLGYGIKRAILSYFLCIINENSIVGIDEAENGLHFDKQNLVISKLLQGSKDFNTQLFITSHSIEYVKRFLNIIEEKGLQDKFCCINLFKDYNNNRCTEILGFDLLKSKISNDFLIAKN